MSDAPDILRLDEMLELLYWLEGEGFKGSATLPAITRFLDRPAGEPEWTLARLVERGDVVRDEAEEYRLTETGRGEAARRFAEEFAPLLAQGHGECNDPECDCQTLGPGECRGARPPR